MKLSKKGTYALRVMRRLADNFGHGPLSVAHLARIEDISLKYLEQVLVTLRKSGFLVSLRGKAGGYMLRVPPEKIMLGNILRAIDGPLAPIPCASRTAPHACTDCPYDYENCWLRSLMLRVRDSISEVLDRQSLAELATAAGKIPRRSAPVD